MTYWELSQLYHLRREVEEDRQRLAALRLAAGYPPASGLFSGGGASSESRQERYMPKIEKLAALIAEKEKRCHAEQLRLEKYIADIPDSYTRRIFTYRFIGGLTWLQVAHRVGGITEDAAKKIVYRYLKKEICPECPEKV